MSKVKNMSISVYRIYIYISIVASLICSINSLNSGKPVYLLPLTYTIALIMCRGIRKRFLLLSVIIINTICLVRYAVYPVFLVLSRDLFFSNEAIYLMIYEVTAVLLFLNFYSRRVSGINIQETITYKKIDLGILNIVLVFFTISLGFIFPSLLSVFVFSGSEAASVSGVISMTFSLGTIVIYISILAKISSWKGGRGVALLLAIIWALSYIFISSIGETNVHRWRFLTIGIPTIYLLVYSFPQYKRSIKTFSFIAIPIAIFLGSFAKIGVSDVSIKSFNALFLTSQSFSAYFGGLNEITNALLILRGSVNAGSFTSTLTDFFGNMPVISRFFNTDLYSTEAIYLEGLGRNDQICPLVVQSVIHFGIIGAPLLSILMVIIAVEGERYAKSAKTVYSLYGSIVLCVTFSLFMCLNTTILFPTLWKMLLFMILQYFNEKYFMNEKAINNSPSIQRR